MTHYSQSSPPLIFPLLIIYPYIHSVAAVGRDGRNDNGSMESGSSGAQLMPYIFPSSTFSGVEGEGSGESDGDEDLSDSSIDENSNNSSSSSLSSKKIRTLSSSCTPLSIAVTDFHFLVLCRVRFTGPQSASRAPSRVESGDGERNKKAEKGKVAEAQRQEQLGSGVGYHLLAMSRLDGSLSESIDLNSGKSSSILRGKQSHQGLGHGGIDLKVKVAPADNTAHNKAALPASPILPREEGMGVDGIPLGIFADPETKGVWLYTDRALYQVPPTLFF